MTVRYRLKQVARAILPARVRLWLWSVVRATRWPPVGAVEFGDLRRLEPFSRNWGVDRGIAVDRYYIEQFLEKNSADIRGRVLEIAENSYTLKFGGDRVTKSDILHATDDNPDATIIADFTSADAIPSDAFDCIICTQTLQLIADLPHALETIDRILKPQGVLLATVPGISQIYRDELNRWTDYWRFTGASAELIFGKIFAKENLTIEARGNVLVSAAFLYGMATADLSTADFDHNDPDYQMLITIRAVKGRE